LSEGIDSALLFLTWFNNPSQFYKDIFGEEPYPYQTKVLDKIKDVINRILICSASGTGKTKLLACIALWFTVVKSNIMNRSYEVIIVSGSQDQAKHLYNYCRYPLLEHPMLADLVEGEPLISITRFKDKSVIRALSRSLTSVQGKHGDVQIIDEASFPELDFFLQDSYRIISTSNDPFLIFSSTPHEYNSLFVNMWENKKRFPEFDKRMPGSWHRMSWSAFDCPNISKEMLEEASNLPRDMFEKYWLGKPYPLIGTMISLEDIRKCSEGYPLFTLEDGGIIIIGIDWGFGRKKDICVVTIVQMIGDIKYVLKAKAFKEQHPDVIVSWIKTSFKSYRVSRIYADAQNKSENMRLLSDGLPVIPIAFNQRKNEMKANLRMLFEKDKIRIPEDFIKLKHQLSRYTWTTNENDDYVDSLMLACIEIRAPEGSDEKPYIISRLKRDVRF